MDLDEAALGCLLKPDITSASVKALRLKWRALFAARWTIDAAAGSEAIAQGRKP